VPRRSVAVSVGALLLSIGLVAVSLAATSKQVVYGDAFVKARGSCLVQRHPAWRNATVSCRGSGRSETLVYWLADPNAYHEQVSTSQNATVKWTHAWASGGCYVRITVSSGKLAVYRVVGQAKFGP
jgi:hypothetical protein